MGKMKSYRILFFILVSVFPTLSFALKEKEYPHQPVSALYETRNLSAGERLEYELTGTCETITVSKYSNPVQELHHDPAKDKEVSFYHIYVWAKDCTARKAKKVRFSVGGKVPGVLHLIYHKDLKPSLKVKTKS